MPQSGSRLVLTTCFWILQAIVGIYGLLRVFLDESIMKSFPFKVRCCLAIAKMGAYMVNLNIALLLVTMSRALWTRVSRIFWGRFFAPDVLKSLHRWSSTCFILGSIIQIIPHLLNLIAFSAGHYFAHPSIILGLVLVAIVALMGIPAYCIAIRHRNFEAFRYLHYLWLPLVILLVLHESFCFFKLRSGKCLSSTTIYWIGIPLMICLIDSAYAWMRARRPTFINKVIQHPSKVLEIQFCQPGFYFVPGQFIFLRLSQISALQWHPFTLTSSPHEDHLAVHIREVGDWTKALQQLLYRTRLDDIRVNIDGPYGCASQNYCKYQSIICIGAGIGQTPFAGILKSLWFQMHQPNPKMTLRKIHYVGISRTLESLEWFCDVLVALERADAENIFCLHQFVTGALSEREIGKVVSHYGLSTRDPNTGLRTQTQYGRPNWDELFSRWKMEMTNHQIVGLFVCGPRVLCDELQNGCKKYSIDGPVFVFHQETF